MKIMYNDNDYLSIAALSGRLGLSEAYLKEQATAGRIPFLIVKGRRKFNVGTVRAALDKIEQQSLRPNRRTILE